jgi:two-component sensor histidine kinase
VYLDRNTAISCGLILNELLADSVARTVDRGIPGDFRVSLKENGNGRLLFSVADNREKELLLKGEPRRRTPEESSLVSVLTRQINGESEIVEDGYHEYRIFFDNLGEGH